MVKSTMLTPIRGILLATGTLAAALLLAPAAQAGPLVAAATDCQEQTLSRPFMPWLDPAEYTLAPDGGFEARGAGWALEDGASVVGGNESYDVGGAGDSHALRLPSGSSATSGVMCVGIEHPTLRLFARNTGSPFSSLRVSVLFEDASGDVRAVAIGQLGAGSSWQPTGVMPLAVNLLALLPGEQTPVAFEFTPYGDGDWKIDDVYVDPYRRS